MHMYDNDNEYKKNDGNTMDNPPEESKTQQTEAYQTFAEKYGFSGSKEENRIAFRKSYGYKTDPDPSEYHDEPAFNDYGKDRYGNRRYHKSKAKRLNKTDIISDLIATIIVVIICCVVSIMLIVSNIGQIKANAEFHSIAPDAYYVSATVVSSYPVARLKRADRIAKFEYSVNGKNYTSKEMQVDHYYLVGKTAHGYVMKNDPTDFRVQTMASGSYMSTSLIISAVSIPLMTLICIIKIYLHKKIKKNYAAQN